MSIEWKNLRLFNGSQNSAFEELCCQLAHNEKIPPGSIFIRKAPPDAGIECYLKYPNGDEWGWQAKFFLSSPGPKQWSQLDNSVKKALEKHPKLKKYTICLPIDRPDARVNDQKSCMERWNIYMKKWERLAKEKGMIVKFDYWGSHEIFERLCREESRGRYFFWFNKELFSNRWFKNKLDEAIAIVGPRYTPELNVELPIANLFDGLGRTSEFYNRAESFYGSIKRAYSNIKSLKNAEIIENNIKPLYTLIVQIILILKNIRSKVVDKIEWDSIAKLCTQTMELAWKCVDLLDNKIIPVENNPVGSENKITRNQISEYKDIRNKLHKSLGIFKELQNFADSSEAQLSNISSLLLVGAAGTGKTHLFCDIAEKRIRSGLPTILLLGNHFNKEEPWSQIVKNLNLNCTKEQFLGSLETVAQASNAKAIILIDALNEGEGINLWNKYLAGMLSTIEKYQWISIAFSVRSSYEEIIIPEGLKPNRMVKEIHHGFAGDEYRAMQKIFDYYGIESPSVPFLEPEFQNPLFLKLLCKGLYDVGLTKIPSGLHGITAIFDFFIDNIDKKLSQPNYLDYDADSKIVHEAIKILVEKMVEGNQNWLPRKEAEAILNDLLPREGYTHSLFYHLISEDIISKDIFWGQDKKWKEGIHFSYQRFSDHLIAKQLLQKHLDQCNPSQSFLPDKPLRFYIKDENHCRSFSGIIEAFSIQLPEQVGKELPELAPNCADFQSIQEALLESLIWRNPKKITKATWQYINSYILNYPNSIEQFINTLLTISSKTDHPYNAEFLNWYLMQLELAERDSEWSIFLHKQFERDEPNAVNRLVDWAWSREDKNNISDISRKLYGIALSWFLTTSNRDLRDCATKALISLFTNRINILREIIPKFLKVNDPYVLERLFAVAYGCIMRSSNNDAIGDLAQDIYEWIFKKEGPPPHILLRDYARGIIELALHRGINLSIDVEKIRPPYKSQWPTKIPTDEELKKYDEWKDDMLDEELAQNTIYSSVIKDGDFARYIIGTNFHGQHFKWSSRRLGEPKKPSQNEMYENFVKSLTKRQNEAWKHYYDISMGFGLYKRAGRTDRIEEFKNEIAHSEKSLRKTLGKKKLKLFDEYVIPYLDNPDPYKIENLFDLSILQRLILKKVFDLGWSVDRFGRFDRDVTLYSHYDRKTKRVERIGKKYQWIAFHEYLARVSDNFEFRDLINGKSEKYEGPWQNGYRDIDPSFLLKKTKRQSWGTHSNTWWFPSKYDAWDLQPDDLKWLKNSENRPDIKPLFEVKKPDASSCWFVLDAFYKWEQPIPPEAERYEVPHREIWYMIKSYIVKKSDINELFNWAKLQDFMGRWMPEARQLYRVYLEEFFWSPAYKYHCTPEYSYEEWTRGAHDNIPKEVLVTAEEYLKELGTRDYSIDETINIYLPCKWLIENMNLKWKGIEGNFYDNKDNLIAFDPSVRTTGPGALLINKDALIKFLNDNNLDILWTIIGEKNIVGEYKHFVGRLEISGVYKIIEDNIIGEITPKFVSR